MIARLYGHIIMRTFTSDGLLYVYKIYKVINCTGMLVCIIILY